jgi:hypothetical protein
MSSQLKIDANRSNALRSTGPVPPKAKPKSPTTAAPAASPPATPSSPSRTPPNSRPSSTASAPPASPPTPTRMSASARWLGRLAPPPRVPHRVRHSHPPPGKRPPARSQSRTTTVLSHPGKPITVARTNPPWTPIPRIQATYSLKNEPTGGPSATSTDHRCAPFRRRRPAARQCPPEATRRAAMPAGGGMPQAGTVVPRRRCPWIRGARRPANRGVLNCTSREPAERNEVDAGISCVAPNGNAG